MYHWAGRCVLRLGNFQKLYVRLYGPLSFGVPIHPLFKSNVLAEDNYRFTFSCKKQYRDIVCNLHLSENINIDTICQAWLDFLSVGGLLCLFSCVQCNHSGQVCMTTAVKVHLRRILTGTHSLHLPSQRKTPHSSNWRHSGRYLWGSNQCPEPEVRSEVCTLTSVAWMIPQTISHRMEIPHLTTEETETTGKRFLVSAPQ